MSNYEQLVKALRYCAESGDFNCNKDCPMYPNYPKCLTKMDMDAAAAIEALQAQLPKRGEWVRKESENTYWLECSECGGYPMRDTWDSEGKLTDFCPRCGADMRKMWEVQE